MLAFALLRPAPAGAQAVPDASRPADVSIVVVGGLEDLERMRDLLDRRLSATRKTAWSRADLLAPADVLGAAPPTGGLRCWLDLRDRRRARMVFAARSGERFLVRDVELSGNFDELDRAALAEVVELSIEALFENDRAGLSRGEAEALLARRAAPPPPSPAASGRSPLADAPAAVRQVTHYELGVFYAAQAQAAGLPVIQGPGLSLARSSELERDSAARRRFVAGWLTGQYRLPETVRGTVAAVRLDAVAARAGLEVGRRQLRARLGAGVDLVHVSPEAVAPSVALSAPHWSYGFALAGSVRLALYAGHGLRLWGSLLVDLLPTAVDYGVDVGGTVTPVFSPWRARPGLAFDVTVP
jgi:hypothetical protein